MNDQRISDLSHDNVPAVPAADVLCEAWLATIPGGQDPKALDPYRSIWRTWVRWLYSTPPGGTLPRCLHWSMATPEHAHDFLVSGLSNSARQRRGKSRTSEITRRRYWSVLNRIYEFARAKYDIAANPAAEMDRKEREKVAPPEDPQGQLLTPEVVVAVVRTVRERSGEWTCGRDRVAVLLLTSLGLRPDEICALKISDCTLLEGGGIILSVPCEADPSRVLTATPVLARAIRDWLPEASKLAVCRPEDPRPLLLMSNALQPLTPNRLFIMVSQLVCAAATRASLDPLHVGPMVLRNTRIVAWLRKGLPVKEVKRLAGLRSVAGFRRLWSHVEDKRGPWSANMA